MKVNHTAICSVQLQFSFYFESELCLCLFLTTCYFVHYRIMDTFECQTFGPQLRLLSSPLAHDGSIDAFKGRQKY